jgi:hypothetical protein
MPPERPNIGRNMASAKRVRWSRSNTNDQLMGVRLLLDCERHVSQRARE